MITFRRFAGKASFIAFAAVFQASGCLPIPRTVPRSPPIQGQYKRADGVPVAGAQVVISTIPDDSTCTRPVARTVTDATGKFELPATKSRQRFVLLLPYDAVYVFRVCIGTADNLHLVHRGQAHGGYPNPATLVLSCVKGMVAEPRDTTAVNCY